MTIKVQTVRINLAHSFIETLYIFIKYSNVDLRTGDTMIYNQTYCDKCLQIYILYISHRYLFTNTKIHVKFPPIVPLNLLDISMLFVILNLLFVERPPKADTGATQRSLPSRLAPRCCGHLQSLLRKQLQTLVG